MAGNIPVGAIINAVAILIGGGIGLLFKGKMSDKVSNTVTRAIGLCVCIIGVSSAIHGDIMLLVVSIMLGALVGELVDIDARLTTLGAFLQSKISKKESPSTAITPQNCPEAARVFGSRQGSADDAGQEGPLGGADEGLSQKHRRIGAVLGGDSCKFAEGFVTATLLFCVGAMAVVGSIEGGLRNDYDIIVTKSIIDATAAMVFASYLGFGVLFSAFAVFIYQGTIEVFAGLLQGVFTDGLITQISAVGGLMILALGFNMALGGKIKVANLLPGLVFATVYYFLVLAG